MSLKKTPTSFNLTDKAQELLARIAEQHGLNKTATVETLIRAEARKLALE